MPTARDFLSCTGSPTHDSRIAQASKRRFARADRDEDDGDSELVPGIKAKTAMNCKLFPGSRVGAALLLLASWGVAPARSEPPPGLDHLVFTTRGAPADARLPMVVALHGLGDRPERFAGLFDGFPLAARVIVPRAPTPYGGGSSWFRIERPPGAAMVGDMRASTDAIAALITRLTARHPTVGRPVVAGFSQGGMLSYALAVHHPKLIAGAVPIAGLLPEALWPKAGPIAPVRALHGVADARVPYAAAEALVLRFVDLGADARLQPFVEVGHQVPPAVRAAAFEAIAALIAPAAAGRRPPGP